MALNAERAKLYKRAVQMGLPGPLNAAGTLFTVLILPGCLENGLFLNFSSPPRELFTSVNGQAHAVFIKTLHYIQCSSEVKHISLFPHLPLLPEGMTEPWPVFCNLPPGELHSISALSRGSTN